MGGSGRRSVETWPSRRDLTVWSAGGGVRDTGASVRAMSAQRARAAHMGPLRGLCGADGHRGDFGAALDGAPASAAPAPAPTATAPMGRAMRARVAVTDLGDNNDAAASPAAGKCDWWYGACAFAFCACVVVVPRYLDVSQLAMANGYWVARSLPAFAPSGASAIGLGPCRGVMPSALQAGVAFGPEVYWHAGRCVRCAPPQTTGGTAAWLVRAPRHLAPGVTNGALRCPGHPPQGALGTCAQQPQQTRRQQPRAGWGLRAGMPMEWPGRVRVATRRRLARPGVRAAALRRSARPVFDRVPRRHKAPARGGRPASAGLACGGAPDASGPTGAPALCPARAASYSLVEEPRLKRERAHGPLGA